MHNTGIKSVIFFSWQHQQLASVQILAHSLTAGRGLVSFLAAPINPRPIERGEREGSYPRPRNIWGPRRCSEIWSTPECTIL